MEANPIPAKSQAAKASKLPLLILGLAVFLLHLMVSGGHLMSPDEELLFRMSESMAFQGTTQIVPLEGDLSTGAVHPQVAESTFATRQGKEPGTFYAQYLPLQPLLAVPLVWGGAALQGLFADSFSSGIQASMVNYYVLSLPEDEQSAALFRRGFLVMLFNPLVAAFSAIVLARLGKFLTGSRSAGLWVGALWAFGTMAWPHSRTFFTEPLAGLLALLAVEQLLRWMNRPLGEGIRHVALLGLFLGLANWTRVDAPAFTVGFWGVLLILSLWKVAKENAWMTGSGKLPLFDLFIAGAIPFGFWLTLQTFNTMRFGGADLTAGYANQTEGVKFTTPLLVGLHGLFFSSGKGMFWFSPALLLGLWGWLRVPCQWRWLRATLFCAYLPFFLAMVMWQNWDGGWCWGPRHIVQIHLPIMLGSCFLFIGPWGNSLKRRVVIYTTGIIAAAVQIYGTSQNPLNYFNEYFVTFDDGVYTKVNFNRGPQLSNFMNSFELVAVDSNQPVAPWDFPAPMVDSLYIPQHTQWAKHREMWQLGYCDWYFWNVIVRKGDTRIWREKL